MGRLRAPVHDQSDLPAGSFETQFTFAQALTETAKLAGNCLLVVSLPASDTSGSPHTQSDDIEVGGQRGPRGARPPAQRRRAHRVVVAAGQRRRGVRDPVRSSLRATDAAVPVVVPRGDRLGNADRGARP